MPDPIETTSAPDTTVDGPWRVPTPRADGTPTHATHRTEAVRTVVTHVLD